MSKHINIPVFIPHAGCPNDCIFCNQKKISGHQSRPSLKSMEEIIDGHLHFIKPDDVCEIAFFGGSFTGLPRKVQRDYLSLADSFVQKGRIEGIRLSTRPDYINESVLTFLKDFPVKVIELGIQSLDEEVLKKSNRGYDADAALKACRLVRQYGFSLGVQVMMGLPGDTLEKNIDTTERLIREKPDMVRIYPALVIKDTGLEREYINGRYRPLSLEQAIVWCSRLIPLYEAAGVRILRIGLLNTENIQAGADVLAGPVHAAFGELVYSRIWLERIEKELQTFKNMLGKELRLYIPPGRLSTVTGQHRKNLEYLKAHYGFSHIKVIEDRAMTHSLSVEIPD